MLGSLGRAAYRRRRLIVCGWLLLILAGIGIGAGVFSQLKDADGVPSAESVRGAQQLRDASTLGPAILVVVADAAVHSPDVRDAVEHLAGRLAEQSFVHDVATATTRRRRVSLHATGARASSRSTHDRARTPRRTTRASTRSAKSWTAKCPARR